MKYKYYLRDTTSPRKLEKFIFFYSSFLILPLLVFVLSTRKISDFCTKIFPAFFFCTCNSVIPSCSTHCFKPPPPLPPSIPANADSHTAIKGRRRVLSLKGQ